MNPPPTFPYRLAAIDLDGTLLGPDKTVSAANLRAVRELEARGVTIVIASGRRYQNSRRFQRELGLNGPIIACQGALVIDPASGQAFEENLLPAPLAADLVRAGGRAGFSVIYYHRERLLAARRDHWISVYESRIGEQVELCPDLESLRGEAALKIVWYGEPAALSALRPRLEADYRNKADVLATEKENLEFMCAGIDKARGLDAVTAHYGLTRAQTLAFGDGENDAPMLRRAGLGVAVSDADDLARKAAGLIGPAGDRETAFARAVEAVFQRLGA